MFEHQKKCNADEKKFFMPLVSNCESCFLRLCLVFLNQKDSDVHNVKKNFKRKMGSKLPEETKEKNMF